MFVWFHHLDIVVMLAGLLLGGCQGSMIVAAGGGETVAASVYDIPRVPVKAIDAADWGELGFRVAAIVDTDLGTAAPEFHAARCRLGWNDQGLLVYMDVRDATPAEGPNIWNGDCVEIFVGLEARNNANRLQYLVSPGRTAEFDKPRIQFAHVDLPQDHRPDSPPEGTKYATRTTADGYVIELLIPWTALGVSPVAGLELGVQLQTVDHGSPKRQFARLAPQLAGPRKPVDLQKIRLAEAGAASPPVLAAMGCEVLPYKPAEALRIVADGNFAGQTATVKIDGMAAGKLTFGKTIGGWTEGLMTWPVMTWPVLLVGDKPPQSVTVVLPGGARATLALSNMLASRLAERRAQFNKLEFTFRPWVFAGEKLPPFEFKQPLMADILSGFNYTIKTRYFDADAKPVEKAEKPGRYGAVVEITALGETKKHFFTLYRVPDDKVLDWRTWMGSDLRIRFEKMPAGFGLNPNVWADDPGRLVSSEFKFFLRHSMDDEGWFFAALLASMSELPEEVLTGKVPPKPVQSPHASHGAYVLKLKQAIGDNPIYPYLMIKPKDYEKATEKRWPLLVCLHGGGQRFRPIEALWREGVIAQEWIREDSPFIVVTPHCPKDEGWTPAGVMAMVDHLIATMRVDPDRICLTGVSMGGYGTWNVAASYPDRIAAIAPLCGGMDPEQAVWLKDMPIWAFHGDADDAVPVEATRSVINRLREATGNAPHPPHIKYTEIPGVGHDIWYLYADRELYNWLLQQRRPARQPAMPEKRNP